MSCFRTLLACICLASLAAQVETGRIIGGAKVETGAVIPNVKVSLTNTLTHRTVETSVRAHGTYESIPLRIGTWKVAVTSEGFKRAVRDDIVLQIGQTVVGSPSNTGDWRAGSDERTLDHWFNTAAFVRNAPFTFGNAGRNLIEGPGGVNFDFAVYKSFSVREGMHVPFRAEAFKVMNAPQSGVPNAQVGNPNFGTIGGAVRPGKPAVRAEVHLVMGQWT